MVYTKARFCQSIQTKIQIWSKYSDIDSDQKTGLKLNPKNLDLVKSLKARSKVL